MGDDVQELLKGLDVLALEQDTGDKPIQHTFTYRGATGRLSGFVPASTNQELKINLDSNDLNYNRSLGETLFATFLERYDTFGAFHHYPRPFLVGPSFFDPKTGKLSGDIRSTAGTDTGSARLRDVDMLMWLKFVADPTSRDSVKAVLSCVHFYHGYRLPGAIAAEWFSFEADIGQGTSTASFMQQSHWTEEDFRAIMFAVFPDSEHYTTVLVPGGINDRVAVTKTDRPLMGLMWIAQRLLLDRYVDPLALPDEAALPGSRHHDMLASAMIGHMAYSIPEDVQQRQKPVSVGWFDTGTLVFVLEKVVQESTARFGGSSSSSSGLRTQEKEKKEEEEEEVITLYDFDEFGADSGSDVSDDMGSDTSTHAGVDTDTEIPLLDSSDEGDTPLDL